MNDSENTFATGNSDGSARLYDLRTLREIGIYNHNKEKKSITDICFSISGRLLIVADEYGKIKVWDVFDQRVPIQIISPHMEKITCMEINASGDKIATGSSDCSIILLQNL